MNKNYFSLFIFLAAAIRVNDYFGDKKYCTVAMKNWRS